MLFKNLTTFTLDEDFDISDEELEAKLQEYPAKQCGPLEVSSLGWCKPSIHSQKYMLCANGISLFFAKEYKKSIPAALVKEELENEILRIEENENRDVYVKERKAIKQKITDELTAKALCAPKMIGVILDRKNGRLLIDASTQKQAEDITNLLRITIGSLKIHHLIALGELEVSLVRQMSKWVYHNDPPLNFSFNFECEIRENVDENEHPAIMRCSNMEVTQDNIKSQIEQVSVVSKLALSWDNRIKFVLDEVFCLKKIKFSDFIIEGFNESEHGDSEEEFLIAAAILFVNEINRPIDALLSHFKMEKLVNDPAITISTSTSSVAAGA